MLRLTRTRCMGRQLTSLTPDLLDSVITVIGRSFWSLGLQTATRTSQYTYPYQEAPMRTAICLRVLDAPNLQLRQFVR
jgi:hypothetical protein